MELRHLRYFLKAAEELSFTRAAEALTITQSTLSHQIKRLERETGPLFDRAGRGICLTSRGKLFKTHAERIVSDVRTSVTALAELDNLVSGQLTIGVYRCFEHSPLPPVLAAFSRKYPSVEMRVHAGNHVDLAHKLIDGSLDLAVAYAPAISEKIVAETIFVEQAQYGHAVAKRQSPIGSGQRNRSDDQSGVRIAGVRDERPERSRQREHNN